MLGTEAGLTCHGSRRCPPSGAAVQPAHPGGSGTRGGHAQPRVYQPGRRPVFDELAWQQRIVCDIPLPPQKTPTLLPPLCPPPRRAEAGLAAQDLQFYLLPTCTYAHTRIYIHICIFFPCACAWYAHAYTYTCTYTYTRKHTHTCTHTHASTHTHAHTHIHIHTAGHLTCRCAVMLSSSSGYRRWFMPVPAE